MAVKRKACLAGHPGCEKCTMHCCNITPERGAEIAEQGQSGANWAGLSHPGAACECGLRSSSYCHRHQKETQ